MSASDRARDFWDRISPRERRLVVIAAVAAPITIAIWLGLQIADGLDDISKRNTKMRRALVVLTDLRARGPLQPTDDVVATMGDQPLSLDTYLRNAANKAGFPIKGTITPRNPVTRNGFVTSSVSISLDDLELEKVKAFLQEVETASKVVAVTNLDIKRDFKDKKLVDAKLEVSTYSKEPVSGDSEGTGSAAPKKGG
ncbi:MAG: type II secretion system protein M [Deltaproteobacteria bacterium]|nr:type II secretion system protein M [Deltaproteobacteria bacterium]MDQ3295728.1 type II secretion system protein M [Myxococcota bacterium]